MIKRLIGLILMATMNQTIADGQPAKSKLRQTGERLSQLLFEMMPILMGMLGLGGLRTIEKIKGAA